MMKTLLFLAGAVLILAGCSSDPCGPGLPEPGVFEVTVATSDGKPLAGAWVEGGIDWNMYRVQTDSSGIARVPEYFRARPARIHKNNFYPRFIEAIGPGEYRLWPTSAVLEHVGDVEGRSIGFYPGVLTTLTYQGVYHAYSYDDTSVTELMSEELAAWAVKDVKFAGERLWLSTHNSGVYAYSVEDPLNPALEFHLDIGGYLGPIAVRGNTIAVGEPWGDDPVRVFSFTDEGEVTLLSTISEFSAARMEFTQDCLVILSFGLFGGVGMRISDLTDPSAPVTVYSLYEQGGRGGLILEEHVLIGHMATDGAMRVSYTTIFIGDPRDPVYMGRTLSDTFLWRVETGPYGVGAYCAENFVCGQHSGMCAVVNGQAGLSFQAAAVLTERVQPEEGNVHSPPFFVLGSGLYRLFERLVCMDH